MLWVSGHTQADQAEEVIRRGLQEFLIIAFQISNTSCHDDFVVSAGIVFYTLFGMVIWLFLVHLGLSQGKTQGITLSLQMVHVITVLSMHGITLCNSITPEKTIIQVSILMIRLLMALH